MGHIEQLLPTCHVNDLQFDTFITRNGKGMVICTADTTLNLRGSWHSKLGGRNPFLSSSKCRQLFSGLGIGYALKRSWFLLLDVEVKNKFHKRLVHFLRSYDATDVGISYCSVMKSTIWKYIYLYTSIIHKKDSTLIMWILMWIIFRGNILTYNW